MKIWSVAFLSASVVLSSNELKRPEPFFTEKNIIQYYVINYPKAGNGGKMPRTLEVTAVLRDGEHISSVIAAEQLNYNGARYGRYVYNFASDSTCFYVCALNWVYQFSLSNNVTQNGDSLYYPYAMKTGDSLPPASAFSKVVYSNYSTANNWSFEDRRVAGIDTLTTPFGPVIAFRIEMNIRKFRVQKYANGQESNKKETVHITEWFAPELGIVKTEQLDPGYGLTTTIMESCKK
jgi:hypothetical protein